MMTAQRGRRVILVVERFGPLRDALAEMLIDAIPDVSVLKAASADRAVVLLARQRPVLAIVDGETGDAAAFSIVRRLRDARPCLPILALGHACEISHARDARSAGALRYLRKSDPPEYLVRAARLVLETIDPSRVRN